MKPYHIIKSFPGSQTGNDLDQFESGTVRHLSPDLASIVVPLGWAEEHIEQPKAKDRDTKVVSIPEKKEDEAAEEAAEKPAKQKKKG
jgi:hypothetical protein